MKSAIEYMESAEYELPCDGAKEMLLVDNVDDKGYLIGLFNSMFDELSAQKPKKEPDEFHFVAPEISYNHEARQIMSMKRNVFNKKRLKTITTIVIAALVFMVIKGIFLILRILVSLKT